MSVQSTGERRVLDFGAPNPKQRQFCLSRARYTAYGGARGGGKTHILRIKAVGGALRWPGIRILILRRTYVDLERTLLTPLLALIPPEVGVYHAARRRISFHNGSSITFGHYSDDRDGGEYQGQEYDWIFVDEATQITEEQFRTLGGCLRGVKDFPRRFYLTCNPGGVGHQWVKRLFVDRHFEEGEDPADYAFIPATVEDNTLLMEKAPEYLRMLDLLPEDIRRAHRYGDWDALAGGYFPEFSRAKHVVEPFSIPKSWTRVRAVDYGLDMFACLWIALSPDGRGVVYREFLRPGLIASEAAREMIARSAGEDILCTAAPPDLAASQKDTGRTIAELFASSGAPLLFVGNERVHGWIAVKEYLKVGENGPNLRIFSDCRGLIASLEGLLHDPKNPSDVATEPHSLTHAADALRYFARWRPMAAPGEEEGLPPLLDF